MIENIKQVLKSKHQFFVWILSYISILLILLFINIFGYYSVINITKQEVDKTNSIIVNQVKHVADNEFSNIENNAHKLINSQSVRTLASVNKYENINKEDLIKNIMTDVSLFNGKDDVIMNTSVIFRNSDICIDANSKFDKQILYQMFFYSYYSTQEACINDLFISDLKQYKIIKNTNDEKKILLIYSYPTIEEVKSVIAVIEINLEAVLKSFELSNSEIFIVDNNNQILASTDKQNSYVFNSNENGGNNIKSYNNRNYIESLLKSDRLPIKYLHLIEKSTYLKKIDTIKLIFTLIYAICMIIGVILAYYFSKRNYKPVDKIVKQLKREQNISNELSEFAYIENVIDTISKDKEIAQKKIKMQNDELKEAFLRKILEGKLAFNKKTISQIRKYSIIISGKYTTVALFNIMELGVTQNDSGELDWNGYEMAHFAISNVISELLADCANIYFCEIGEMYACILNYNESTKNSGYLVQKIQFANEFLKEHLGMEFICALSQVTENAENISNLYQQANEIMSYRYIVNEKHTLTYDDIIHNNGVYAFTTDQENSIVNNITLGNDVEANKIISEVVNRNLCNKNININMMRILITELVSTILKTTIEVDKNTQLDIVNFCKLTTNLTDMSILHDVIIQMQNFVTKLCEISQVSQNNIQDMRSDKIKKYVKDNYGNPDLSISGIADIFGLSTNYLSRDFKNQAGVGLADYIVRFRINKAKEMLVLTDESVTQIAVYTGFYSTNVFIRAFKKLEGITPGKYRESKDS